VVLLLAGCGCNTEGCGNDLRFSAAALAQWAGSESYVVEVCADGACQSLEVSDSSKSRSFGFPVGEDVSGEVEVEISVSVGSVVKRASGLVQLESHRPNGRLCGPVCPGADLTIDKDTVRNAEPGEIVPRD